MENHAARRAAKQTDMLKLTVNKAILEYLKDRKIRFGGEIENRVGTRTRTKSSVIAVRLRELSRFTWSPLDKKLVANPKGRGPKVLIYRKKDKKI